MREIKFRVWDNVDHMSTPFTFQDLQENKIQFTPDCKVMQYTGIKDKNGVEIFEGDIIKDSKGDAVVHYLSAQFVAIDKKGDIFQIGKGYVGVVKLEETQVIGNIHENKDLLK